MKDVLSVTFGDLETPFALVDCGHLLEYFPTILPHWKINVLPGCCQSPILTLRREKGIYILQADWLKTPVRRADMVDAICSLVAELVGAHVRNNANLLCLHGAAANFAGKLVVFPNKYRAGKSLLSACLAANDVQLFCDDVLPINIDNGYGVAPGLAPRLRIPLPHNLDPACKNFIQIKSGLAGKQYLYLDLDSKHLAVRGSLAPVGAFVLLDREEGAMASLTEIAEAEVLHQVVWQNFGREAEAPEILGRLGKMVSTAGRFRLRYDRVEDAVELLRESFKDWTSMLPQESETRLSVAVKTGSPVDVPPGCYMRNPDITIISIDGESFLADAQGAAIYHLNPVGSAIWTLLAEPVTMADMTELLSSAFPDVDEDQIRSDVTALINSLMSRKLLLAGVSEA